MPALAAPFATIVDSASTAANNTSTNAARAYPNPDEIADTFRATIAGSFHVPLFDKFAALSRRSLTQIKPEDADAYKLPTIAIAECERGAARSSPFTSPGSTHDGQRQTGGLLDMRLILPMPGNEIFARHLADAGGCELGAIETRRFPDGESYVRILADVADRSVDLVCTLARPDEGFLRLVFTADAAWSLGAREVTLIAPYLAYMRQDRRFQPGEAVTSASFARLLSSGFDRLVTVDPHLHRYPTLSSLYTIRTDTLHAAPLLADWISAEVRDPLLIGPDEESEQWVSAIAARIGAPHAVLRKIRHGDRDVEIELPDLSAWRARRPVLVDDIASSGRTLIEAARKLRLQGFVPPIVAVVHGIFAEDSYQRLTGLCDRIVSTDSVPHASNQIGLARLIADAIASSASGDADLVRHRRPSEPPDDVERAGIGPFPASEPLPRPSGIATGPAERSGQALNTPRSMKLSASTSRGTPC